MEQNDFHLKVTKIQQPLIDGDIIGLFIVPFAIGFIINFRSSGIILNSLYYGIGLGAFFPLVLITGHLLHARFHILELEQKGDVLDITFLDKRVIKHATVPVNALMIGVGADRAGRLTYMALGHYDIHGDTFITKQYPRNGWTVALIIEVYNHFCVYNPVINSPPFTQEQIERLCG